MRSVIGQMELDRTFEERERINAQIVASVDQASDPWGVKVTRYEVQNINVPPSVLESMEYQIRAERDKRAVVARSVGEMESRINRSIGEMEEAINRSEGEKQRQINEAEGRAEEIVALAPRHRHGTGTDGRRHRCRRRRGGDADADRRSLPGTAPQVVERRHRGGAADGPDRHQLAWWTRCAARCSRLRAGPPRRPRLRLRRATDS